MPNGNKADCSVIYVLHAYYMRHNTLSLSHSLMHKSDASHFLIADLLMSQVPVQKQDLQFVLLMYSMKNAFEAGMINGQAKMFLVALMMYLLDDDMNTGLKLSLYSDQLPTVTKVHDPIAGKARFMAKMDFAMSDMFPTNQDTKRRRGKPSTTSTVQLRILLHVLQAAVWPAGLADLAPILHPRRCTTFHQIVH